MTNPTFSICIPNFNHGRYIGQTIESVLAQAYGEYEIVVVDNASTDDSVKVIESFASERLRLYRNPYNVGFAPNLDRAAGKARNEFIIVLSADDLMMPGALNAYAAVISELGPEACRTLLVSAYETVDGAGAKTGLVRRADIFEVPAADTPPVPLASPDTAIYEGRTVFADIFPRMQTPSAFCTTAFSRALYDSVGGYGSVNLIGPDAHFAYKCLMRGAWLTFVDRPLFQYRVHPGGQLGTAKRDAILKVPMDRYLFCFQYSDAELASAGVERGQMITHLVDEACIRAGARLAAEGARLEALRHALFAAAAYPRVCISRLQFWGLLGALCLGPVGTLLLRFTARQIRAQRTLRPDVVA